MDLLVFSDGSLPKVAALGPSLKLLGSVGRLAEDKNYTNTL